MTWHDQEQVVVVTDWGHAKIADFTTSHLCLGVPVGESVDAQTLGVDRRGRSTSKTQDASPYDSSVHGVNLEIAV